MTKRTYGVCQHCLRVGMYPRNTTGDWRCKYCGEVTTEKPPTHDSKRYGRTTLACAECNDSSVRKRVKTGDYYCIRCKKPVKVIERSVKRQGGFNSAHFGSNTMRKAKGVSLC